MVPKTLSLCLRQVDSASGKKLVLNTRQVNRVKMVNGVKIHLFHHLTAFRQAFTLHRACYFSQAMKPVFCGQAR